MTSMRLAFMGTPDFAVPALAALCDAGHDVACVYSQPPRPAGRGKKDRPSPVQVWAEARGLMVRTPTSLKDSGVERGFAELGLDAAVVAAYGLILPPAILEAPRLGCFNIHASLLPRWRGAAPVARAIMAGDARSGVTIMAVDQGLDTGPMLLSSETSIAPGETAGELEARLAAMGAGLIIQALIGLSAGRLTSVAQEDHESTYAAKIDKAEARIDWNQDAIQVDRRIRGLSPAPGAWFEYQGERIKVLLCEPLDRAPGGGPPPGTVLDEALTIACASGALRCIAVQRAGKGPMVVADLLRGFPIPAGAGLAKINDDDAESD